MSDIKFVDGLRVEAPREGAPDFVKGRISLHKDELIQWLGQQEGEWINLDVKVSKNDKWYASVNDWKPQQGQSAPKDEARRNPTYEKTGETPPPGDFDDDIPFRQYEFNAVV